MAAKPKPKIAGSFEEILAVADVGEKVVEVEEWGCAVKVRGLTRGEARRIGQDDLSAEDAEVFALSVAMLEPVLSEEQARRLVNEKGFAATEKILNEILDLSGMRPGFRS